jgi:hypothetical protein
MNYELQRFAVALGFIILLLPLGSVFWVLARTATTPLADERAHLEASLRQDVLKLQGESPADAGPVVTSQTVSVTTLVGVRWFPWFGFYPRQWVGWLGLGALGVAGICLLVSLYVPNAPRLTGSVWIEEPGGKPTIEIKER